MFRKKGSSCVDREKQQFLLWDARSPSHSEGMIFNSMKRSQVCILGPYIWEEDANLHFR